MNFLAAPYDMDVQTESKRNMDDNAVSVDSLYRETGPQLLAWLARRHGDGSAAEDLLQETFAAVMRRPEAALRSDSPRAYLFGIARHLSADAHRRPKIFEPMPAEVAAPAREEDPKLAAMREALARLEPPAREILELRLQAELSYEEIAAALEIPIGTVRSRLHHAVRRLREAMKKETDL